MDQPNVLNEFNEPSNEPATMGQRLANYLIDIVIFYAFIFIISMIFGASLVASGNADAATTDAEVEAAMGGIGIIYLVVFAVFFAYYTLLEGSKGKTIGKMVTKTRVVRDDGEPMNFGKAFFRALCRIVPFEVLSIFFGNGKMWHDSWTGTSVVKDK
jgi:uncharacterized RDD family membrane protein YckC